MSLTYSINTHLQASRQTETEKQRDREAQHQRPHASPTRTKTKHRPRPTTNPHRIRGTMDRTPHIWNENQNAKEDQRQRNSKSESRGQLFTQSPASAQEAYQAILTEQRDARPRATRMILTRPWEIFAAIFLRFKNGNNRNVSNHGNCDSRNLSLFYFNFQQEHIRRVLAGRNA